MAAAEGLELAGVRRAYGDRVALAGVDLAVAPGEVLALLGPNGAGKSTLVGVAAGLLRPDAGTVRVCGVDPGVERVAAAGMLGLAPQEIGLYPSLTVRQNLRAAAELHGLSARRARARTEELLGPMGLGALGDRVAAGLSGGEQRRVHAAVALVNRPRVILMDEPTAGADPQTRAALLVMVQALAVDGAAVVYTTHYLPEVEQLGASVAMLERGRIVAAGPVDALIAAHARPVLELGFTGAVPSWLDGESAGGGRVRVACDDPAATLAGIMARLGDDARRLEAAEIVRPSLEAAYLAITGRRHAEEPAT